MVWRNLDHNQYVCMTVILRTCFVIVKFVACQYISLCTIIDFTVDAVKVRLRSIRDYYSTMYRKVIKYVIKNGKDKVNITYCKICLN